MEKLAPRETTDHESMQEKEAGLCLMMRPNEGMKAYDAKRHGRVRPHKKAEIREASLNREEPLIESSEKRNASTSFPKIENKGYNCMSKCLKNFFERQETALNPDVSIFPEGVSPFPSAPLPCVVSRNHFSESL
ncbi:hypothetical protein DYE48_18990 [Halobacillus trueperi]|uniref:Uncharacterized protein n=1 Tax=Halobacillus trueperi TaxID=156205 RepID=A0A3E0J0D8_9BACI|nr:hypothetical protein DYE48_18990 [Halobacillus trueperi]